MIDQFECTYNILTTADSGPRNLATIQLGVFHTTENEDTTDPRAVARWQQNRANGSSYNVLVGTNGETVRSNDDNYIPWSAGQTANRVGVHCSAIGYASRDRAGWIRHPAQIESMARWAANVSTRYGLPLKWLTPDEVRAGHKGFCGHAEVSAAWKEVNHWDPGAGFPRDLVLERATALTTKKEDKPVPRHAKLEDIDEKADLVMDQLAGYPWREWKGWPQLGNRTLVNALAAIGEKLGVEGMREHD